VSRRGPIIAGAIVAVIAVLAVFFLVLPKMSEMSETREEIATAEAQETALRAQLASLKEAQANAPQVKAEIAKLAASIRKAVARSLASASLRRRSTPSGVMSSRTRSNGTGARTGGVAVGRAPASAAVMRVILARQVEVGSP